MPRRSVLALLALVPSLVHAAPVQQATFDEPVSLIDRAIARGEFPVASKIATAIGAADVRLRWLPDYVDGYAALAKGDATRAERISRKLVALLPADAHPRHLLIMALWEQKKYRAAMYQVEVNKPRVADPP